MANGIKGITISIGGDTTGLENSLKDVNKQSKDLQKELKEVERALKLDPGNVELVRQKQELLTASIEGTKQKLDVLKTAQAQVEAQFQRGDIGVEQYRAFQRELQSTEGELNRLQGQFNSIGAEQDRLGQTTRQLGTFFEATRTDVEQFSGTLGTRLTQAIRDGSANADQMERALRLMSRQALGASADIDQLREALRRADDGASLDQIRFDLSQIGNAANEAGDEVNGFGDDLKGVVAGLAAGGGIGLAIQQALDVSSLNTDIAISMNLNEEDTKAVRQSIMQVTAAIGDEEAAYEGVRRQMTLNKDASIETNQEIIMGAATISRAYKEIDFKELIQETHEIGKELKISQLEAVGLVNSLLDVGFPPEQLDIIAEYGSQLVRAGYSAEQVQAIMASGVATGTWNIDILLDGLKEGRIVAAEFGVGVDKAMKEVLTGTNISAAQLQTWGKAVATGGQGGVQAIQEMTMALALVDDETKRNELGVKLFGTLWEEQGGKIQDTILNMNEHIRTAGENTKELNSDVADLNSDPAYQLAVAVGSIKEALAPVLGVIAELVAKIGEWVSNNTTLSAAIVGTVAVIGTLVGTFVALMPAIGGLVTAWPALAVAIGAISAPITLIIGAIAGLGVALVAAYQSSETFRENVNNVFQAIKDVAVAVFETVASFIGEKTAQIKQFWDTNGQQFLQAVENVFNGIKAVIEFVMPLVLAIIKDTWESIKGTIDGVIKIITGVIKTFSSLLTGDFKGMWEGIKGIFDGAVQFIGNLIELWFVGKILKIFKTFSDGAFKFVTEMVSKVKDKFDEFVNVAKDKFESVKNSIMNPINTAKDKVGEFISTLTTNFISKISSLSSTVSTTFGVIKDAIVKPIETARDLVKTAIDKIIGFFTGMKLEFPSIKMPKLPHFKLTGDFSLNPPRVPKLDIEWYAKGGIMTRPTAFGMNGNNMMVGGEAGPEAILPLNSRTLGAIGEGIAQTMGSVIEKLSQSSEAMRNSSANLQDALNSAYSSLASSASKSADINTRNQAIQSRNTTNNSMPVNVNLNYSGSASMPDMMALADFLERELGNRFNNQLRLQGSKR